MIQVRQRCDVFGAFARHQAYWESEAVVRGWFFAEGDILIEMVNIGARVRDF